MSKICVVLFPSCCIKILMYIAVSPSSRPGLKCVGGLCAPDRDAVTVQLVAVSRPATPCRMIRGERGDSDDQHESPRALVCAGLGRGSSLGQRWRR